MKPDAFASPVAGLGLDPRGPDGVALGFGLFQVARAALCTDVPLHVGAACVRLHGPAAHDPDAVHLFRKASWFGARSQYEKVALKLGKDGCACDASKDI